MNAWRALWTRTVFLLTRAVNLSEAGHACDDKTPTGSTCLRLLPAPMNIHTSTGMQQATRQEAGAVAAANLDGRQKNLLYALVFCILDPALLLSFYAEKLLQASIITVNLRN